MKNRSAAIRTLIALALLSELLRLNAQAQKHPNVVVVRPHEIQDVLTNPGMGITTFQRFNGQTLNPPLTWSERGPETKLPQAATKPDFPDTSIAYCRWYWDTIEPEPGKFRWDIIDLALAEAHAHGQTLAIRLMPYSNQDPLPAWYRKSGARRANKPEDKDGSIWQPDFSDPAFLKYWGELVAEAGKRYDGNPYLDSVDISSIGYWGEGWSSYMPDFKYQAPLIDIWLKAFPRTTLLMNFDEPQALTYGTAHGAGWRLDCLGDMRTSSDDPYFPAEMLEIYPQQVVRSGIQDVWQKRPVSLETCGTPSSWKKDGYDVDYILDQALRWHVSSVNVKSSPIPAEWKPNFERFEKRMGYRFILRRMEYPRAVAPGEMMLVHMWWLNAGVAPIYREYPLAIELRSGRDSAVIRVPADVRTWLPGDAVFDGTLYIPDTLPPATYSFRVAMIDPLTNKPAIRLAIDGRDSDGWYDMGTVSVGPR
ncbi:MAG TPA: DUF4832 domain-containing protein [Acidobacteriaceae bacterium]|nr:DUF4832 domain-containing protein [Acidobacteriaceae bacterium]